MKKQIDGDYDPTTHRNKMRKIVAMVKVREHLNALQSAGMSKRDRDLVYTSVLSMVEHGVIPIEHREV